MLRRYSEVVRGILIAADLVLIAASWLAAYAIRFHTVFDAPRGIPEFTPYAALLILILPLWHWLFRSRGLYEARRTARLSAELAAVVAATASGVVLLVAVAFFTRSYFYSRGVIALFAVLSVVSVAGFRLLARLFLRALRRRGYNQRYVLVVGAGDLAEEVIARISAHPEVGIRVVGVLAGEDRGPGRKVAGVPVVGSYGAVKSVLAEQRVDQVILALPREDAPVMEKVLSDLDDELCTVHLVPDLLHVMTLRSSVDELDGLPIIHLRESPLVGWAAVQKRAFDLVVSATALVLLSPLLAAIALAIRLVDGAPVLYGQERMGLDGVVFRCLKFRTMRPDSEAATGPVWSSPDDPRRTRLGAFLRRTNLDELPQLWNVLRGDMSLVGPRPERPVFIEQFRREIPGYMLRHKVKAGLTGWAQVHGWRGDTSVQERVEHDIYYIQNWSLGLDIRILLMTVWRGFRNAY